MHIAFKFKYIHNNGLFTRLFNRIETLSNTPLSLYQDGTEYRIEASGDQPTLETLAEQISAHIPQSLFLEAHTIEEIEKEDDTESISLALAKNADVFEVPYCPECQENVIKTSNPFTSCTVCGFSEVSLSPWKTSQLLQASQRQQRKHFL